MKQKLNINDFTGAIMILENYLDGAVADFENGDVENDYLIQSSIDTIKLIYSLTSPLLLLSGNEYEERMNKARHTRNLDENIEDK